MEYVKKTNQRHFFTCSMANILVYQRGFDRSNAFKCAHALYRLAEWLAKGLVEFSYMKEDGTIRHARGTLCDGVSEQFDEWKRKQAEKPKDKAKESEDSVKQVVKYWDVDKEAFRSFKAENLLLSNTDKTDLKNDGERV